MFTRLARLAVMVGGGDLEGIAVPETEGAESFVNRDLYTVSGSIRMVDKVVKTHRLPSERQMNLTLPMAAFGAELLETAVVDGPSPRVWIDSERFREVVFIFNQHRNVSRRI